MWIWLNLVHNSKYNNFLNISISSLFKPYRINYWMKIWNKPYITYMVVYSLIMEQLYHKKKLNKQYNYYYNMSRKTIFSKMTQLNQQLKMLFLLSLKYHSLKINIIIYNSNYLLLYKDCHYHLMKKRVKPLIDTWCYLYSPIIKLLRVISKSFQSIYRN